MSEDELAGATQWFDHAGNIMTAPASDRPTGYNRYDQLNHRIFRSPGTTIQAISLCGCRVHEVPARAEVDCPECLVIPAEHDNT